MQGQATVILEFKSPDHNTEEGVKLSHETLIEQIEDVIKEAVFNGNLDCFIPELCINLECENVYVEELDID